MCTPAPPSSARWWRRRASIRAAAALTTLLVLAFAAPAVADDAVLPEASPAPRLTSGPTSPDNNLAPRWSFSVEEVATAECSLSRGETLVGDWAPCVSPAAYDLASQPDGTYTFAVRAIGADGVPSQTATGEYTLDTSVPALPGLIDLPGPVASDSSPVWTFAGGADETFECRVEGESELIADWSPCSSPHEVDLTGQPDGSYVFSVRGVAGDGTRGPARAEGYVLDSRPPDAPDISSSPAPVGKGRGARLAFSSEPGGQVECRVAGEGVTAPEWAPCTSPHAYDLRGLPDGAYTLVLRATDAAGNTGPEAAASYTLDTTPADPPAVGAPSVTPATRLQPAFSFANDPAQTFECALDGPGGLTTGWQPCTSPAPYDLTGQPNGRYTFAVRSTDAAGNTSAPAGASYELTRDPRAVDLRTGPGRIGRTRQPRWTFQVSGGSGFVCGLELQSAAVFGPATCGSPRSYNLSGKPDGTYTFTVRASGSGSAMREPATQKYELDSTAPRRPVVKAAPVSPAADHTPAWGFGGEDGAALDCRVSRGGATVVDWTSCTKPTEFDLNGAADGDYRVAVRARDAAGNESPIETSDYQLDSTPPAAPVVNAAPSADTIDRSPTWTFSGESGAVYTCTLSRGSDIVAAKTSCAQSKTYNLSGAPAGTYTFTVQATDAAGNTSPARSARYILAAAPKAVTTTPGGGTGAGGAGSGAGSGDPRTDLVAEATATGVPTAQSGTAQPRATGGARTPTRAEGARRTQAALQAPGLRAAAERAQSSRASRRPAPDRWRGDRSAGPARGTPDTPAGRDRQPHRQGIADAVKDAARGAKRGTTKVLTGDAAKVVFPMSVLFLIGGFLLVQGRIDRSDPKLALAPIDGAPDLEFVPPPTRR